MYLSRRARTSPTDSMSLAALITPASSNSASYRDTLERRFCVEEPEFAGFSFIVP